MAVKKEGMFDFSAKKSLAIELFDCGVFRDEDMSSSIYFDFRFKPGGPVGYDLLYEMAEMLYEEAHKYSIFYNCVAGIAGAGDVVAWALRDQAAYKLIGQSKISFAKISKDRDNVKGDFKRGDEVLLAMDVMISAENCLKTIHLLEGKGLKIAAVAAVIDQDEVESKELGKEGYGFYPLMTSFDFLMFCLDAKKINCETYKNIRDFRRRALKD